MNWPRHIIFVRHAQSEGNVRLFNLEEHVEKSNFLYDLTPHGREQAEITGKWLRERFPRIDAHYASTYVRTQQTHQVMYPDAPLRIDSRLNEHHRGIWHRYPLNYCKTHHAEDEVANKREGWYHQRPIGGESGADVEVRLYSFLHHLREFHAKQTVLVVCHGSWLILGWRVAMQGTAEQVNERFQSGKFFNAAVTIFEPDPDTGWIKVTTDNFAPWAPEGGKDYTGDTHGQLIHPVS